MQTKVLFLILTFFLVLQFAYAEELCICPCETPENSTSQENNTLPEGVCNVALSLSTNNLTFKNKDKIEIYNNLTDKKHEFIIEYWIEDQDGNILKKKTETTNTIKKQYTVKIEDSQNITIRNNLKEIDCENINNKTANELEVYIEVPKDPYPDIKIEKIYTGYNKTIDINDSLVITISAYSGNLTNLAIESYIENVTNISKYSIHNQFNKTEFNFTLKIPDNCILNGAKQLKIEYLNQTIREIINIEGECQEIKEYEENIPILVDINNSNETIINLAANQIMGELIYESSNQKIKEIAAYLGMIIMIVITISALITSKKTNKVLTKTSEKWSSQLEQQ